MGVLGPYKLVVILFALQFHNDNFICIKIIDLILFQCMATCGLYGYRSIQYPR
jgi:hypothetical protein